MNNTVGPNYRIIPLYTFVIFNEATESMLFEKCSLLGLWFSLENAET